ncbi:hypothetical protein SLS63_002265 [Diaporthe eres]|uniref:Serin endopeptidase n=1 Tax=Diaporthe eres TaxID=83184 RepID=A0ABR1PKN6_DIAER
MRATRTLLALLGATSSAWATVHFPSRRDLNETSPSPSSDTVPRRYIVELKSRAQCSRFFDKVAGTAGLKVVKQFDSDLFPGVSVECDHACTEDSLRAALDDGAGGDAAVATVYKSTRVRILDTVKGESFSDDAAASNYSVHGITGVEKLHEDGIFGAGAVVAIVDSGVEYTHPAVFATDGYSNEETVIEGFLKAFESGADIISASLGEESGFTTNAWAVVASRMVDQGVVVVVAAGNAADKIVLVRSGGCYLTDKHRNLVPFNPQYILFYNNDGPFEDPNTRQTPGVTGMIEARAGEAIIETILAGGNVTASFNVNNTGHYVGLFNAGSGRPARYSSWGATYDLTLKPDVSAPGTKILSTYLNSGYQVLSGTSMATPYIAGVAALWVGQFGGRKAHADDPAWAQRLVSRITATGRAVPWADWSTSAKDYGFWTPTVQIGSGLVDAAAVLNYTTELSFDGRKFEMNDTANFVGTHTVDIFNNGKEAVTYKFSLQGAGGFESYKPDAPDVMRYDEVVLVEFDPTVDLPGELTVEPGQKATAEVTFTAPTGLDVTKLPVYSGKVLISGSNGEELGIPYFGMYNTFLGFPHLRSGPNSVELTIKPNMTFNLTYTSQDFPRWNNWLTWGSRELRWDIFDAEYTEADWKYPPVVGENHFIGSATSWNGTDIASYFDPSRHSQDDIFSFPLYNLPRNAWERYWWLGRYANGSTIVPGEY